MCPMDAEGTEKLLSCLAEWAEAYTRHRSIYAKDVQSVVRKGQVLEVVKSEGKEIYCLFLGGWDLSLVESKEAHRIFIVSFNNEESFRELVKHWQQLLSHKNLRVVMVNPFSTGEHKWMVSPAVHHTIAEEGALEKGLLSLFKSVEQVSLADALAALERVPEEPEE